MHGGIWGQGEFRRSAGGQKTWGKLYALVHNLTAPVSGVYGWEDHVSGRQAACTFLGEATESVTYEGLPAFAAPNQVPSLKNRDAPPIGRSMACACVLVCGALLQGLADLQVGTLVRGSPTNFHMEPRKTRRLWRKLLLPTHTQHDCRDQVLHP